MCVQPKVNKFLRPHGVAWDETKKTLSLVSFMLIICVVCKVSIFTKAYLELLINQGLNKPVSVKNKNYVTGP